MAVIVNNPSSEPAPERSSGLGMVLAVILLIVLAVLFLRGLPFIGSAGPSNPQINVPGKIDVNVNNPGAK